MLLFRRGSTTRSCSTATDIERVAQELVEEETLNRQLRLEYERCTRRSAREARRQRAAHGGAARRQTRSSSKSVPATTAGKGDRGRGSVKGAARDRRHSRRLSGPARPSKVSGGSAIKRRVVFVLTAITLWGARRSRRGSSGCRSSSTTTTSTTRAQAAAQPRDRSTAPRGDIVDRHGQMLATSAEGTAITADPSEVEDPVGTAAQLCAALRDCTPKEQSRLRHASCPRKGYFAYLRRWRSVSTRADRARDRRWSFRASRSCPSPGATTRTGAGRAPARFVGIDNKGLGGTRVAYDSQVRGQPARLLVQRRRHSSAMQTRVERAPVAGRDARADDRSRPPVHRRARARSRGRRSTTRRAGRRSSWIRTPARSSRSRTIPTFNPNALRPRPPTTSGATARRRTSTSRARRSRSSPRRRRIEEGVLKATDLIDCNPGVITFPGRKPITEAKGHNYGVLPFEDVIVKSSNIGAIKAGLRVGAERMSRYVQRFGFGEALGTDFKGRARASSADGPRSTTARSRRCRWATRSASRRCRWSRPRARSPTAARSTSRTSCARSSATASARSIAPKVLRQAINPETAATLTTIMEGVVDARHGQGRADGRLSGGRQDRHGAASSSTGTTRTSTTRRLSASSRRASPVFTILVVIDTPRAGRPLRRRGRGAGVQAHRRRRAAPGRRAGDDSIRCRRSSSRRLTSVSCRQQVLPTVIPVMTPVGDRKVMPDVRGLAARDACGRSGAMGLSVRLRGSGFVTAQTPEAGRLVDSGEVSVLELRRTLSDASKSSGGNER